MSERKFCVYVHINKTNGKKYVGITCRDPKLRWQNGRGYKQHKKFYAAILKYGWDGFEHKILLSGLNFEQANLKEQELIKFYNSVDNGYNLTNGGEGTLGFSHTESSKLKMSEIRKGQKLSEEWKKHLSQSLKGREGSNKGGTLSENHKQKISKGLHRYYTTNENASTHNRGKFPSKLVVCEGVEFNSIKDCAEFYNVDNSQMGRWLNGKSFVPKEFVDKNLHYKDIDPNYTLCQFKTQEVYCDGTIYKSLRQCSEETGYCFKSLKKWIEGDDSSPVVIYLVSSYGYKSILK